MAEGLLYPTLDGVTLKPVFLYGDKKRLDFLLLTQKIDNLWNGTVLYELGMSNNYNTVSCHLKRGIYSPT
jgi:hypothetical protein